MANSKNKAIKKPKATSKSNEKNNKVNSARTTISSKESKPKNKNIKVTKPKKVKKENIKKKAKRKIRVKKPFSYKLLQFIKWMLLLILIVGIAVSIVLGLFVKQSIEKIPEHDINKIFALENKSILYDKDGIEFGRIGGHNREIVSYGDIPNVLIDALISIEDSKFFVHNGVDYTRFGKAILDVFLKGSFDGSGASTLTMQAAKNAITNPGIKKETTIEKIERKVQDLYLSTFVIEKSFTKEEIIEFYVNSSFLGGGAWGVQAAADSYFDKDVSELNLAEASFIVGLFQAPYYYDPYLNGPERAEKRRNIVLNLMVRHGYISQETCDLTKSIPLESYLTGYKDISDEYVDYINTVVVEITERTGYDPYMTPMKIYTNMDRDLQDFLISIKKGEHEDIEFPDNEINMGLVMIETNSSIIRGVINGRNTVTKGLGYATSVKTHPGSTAKPLFDYGPCFEQGLCTSTAQYILDDSYGYKDGQQIYNWDRKYKDLITINDALAASRNIPALKIFHQLDNEKVTDFVKGLGITPEANGKYLFESHSLGSFEPGATPLELASAYAAFGNDGVYTEPSSVSYIVVDALQEKITFEQKSTRAMTSETAFMVNEMLIQSVEGDVSLIKYLREKGINNAAKTGTSNWDVKYADSVGTDITSKDLYLINYNPHYSIGYWMGYGTLTEEHVENNWLLTRSKKTFSKKIIEAIYASDFIPRDNKDFEFSTKNIVEASYEKRTIPLQLPSANTPDDMIDKGYFIKGTEPTVVSNRFLLAKGPSGLNASYNSTDGSVKLTWSKGQLPKSANYTYLENYFKKNYSPNYFRHMMAYIEENQRYLGDVGYMIQLYSGDGQFIRDIDYIALPNQSFIITPDEYASHVTKGGIKFKLFMKYESGLTGGHIHSNTVNVDLTGKKHLISTSTSFNYDNSKYNHIEFGTEFHIPEVVMYQPSKYPGQEDVIEDEFITISNIEGNKLGPDQPRYYEPNSTVEPLIEEYTINFNDPSITKVTIDDIEVSDDFSFNIVRDHSYTINVTRIIGTQDNPDDPDDPDNPDDPIIITEDYSFDVKLLKNNPILSYNPKMNKVPYNSITKKVYLVNNDSYEEVGYIDTKRVGKYEVVYTYKNSNGFSTNAVRHFRVHYTSQVLIDKQLYEEAKARKQNLAN